jgi:hypothetical protein
LSFRAGKVFEELPRQDAPHFQKLLLFALDNRIAYHWQRPTDGSPFAYQQFVYSGDETMLVHSVVRNFFDARRHPVINYFCQGNKRRDECNVGQLDVKTNLVLTHTSAGNQVPFYLQPTLGGSNIDSVVTLRGYDDYRFRASDLALVQVEYGVPLYDPLGLFVFYDAGTVGNSASDLALGHFRQDAGIGVSARIRGHIVVQGYCAFGAGDSRWGYNFARVF